MLRACNHGYVSYRHAVIRIVQVISYVDLYMLLTIFCVLYVVIYYIIMISVLKYVSFPI